MYNSYKVRFCDTCIHYGESHSKVASGTTLHGWIEEEVKLILKEDLHCRNVNI